MPTPNTLENLDKVFKKPTPEEFRRATIGYPGEQTIYDLSNSALEQIENIIRKVVYQETKPHSLIPLPGELDRLKAEFDKRKEYGL
jgi:hypothetical protein